LSIGYFKRRGDLPHIESCTIPWKYLVPQMLGQDDLELAWDFDPVYQRDKVWTLKQKEDFIGHCLGGGIRGLIYVQRFSVDTANLPEGYTSVLDVPSEVVDGKQRALAIIDFVEGRIKGNTWHDGAMHRYGWDDLSRGEKGMGGPCVEQVGYMDCSFDARVRWYLKVNGGGTPHTAEDLAKARALLDK